MTKARNRKGLILSVILTSIAALMPAGNLFAGAAPSLVPNTPADQPFITYNISGAVANSDTVNSHNVVGSLGWWNGGGTGTQTIFIYGDDNGLSLQCVANARRVTDGAIFGGSAGITTANGVFTISSSVTPGSFGSYLVGVWCSIPRVSGGKAARIYGF